MIKYSETRLKDEISLCFAHLGDFLVEAKTNEQAIKYNAIALSIKQYDINHEYCVLIMIDKEIRGGALIPFDQPDKLQSLLDREIADYN